METSTLILALLSAVVLLNVIATVRVIMSSLFEARQKFMQCAVIWLIPVLGAGIALAIAGQPDIPRRRRRGTDPLALGGTEMMELEHANFDGHRE